jgi:hypothetical protein
MQKPENKILLLISVATVFGGAVLLFPIGSVFG